MIGPLTDRRRAKSVYSVCWVLYLSPDVSSALFPPFFFVRVLYSLLSRSHHDGLSMKEPSVSSVLLPARVLGARHSPLTRLGCHVRWLTGKVTSGDKRPQLESVRTPPPPLSFLSSTTPSHSRTHTHTDPSKCIHPSTLEKSARCFYTVQTAFRELTFN